MPEWLAQPRRDKSKRSDVADGAVHDPQVGGLDDPRALSILTTEHSSLVAARSLVYNEAFTRAGMFLAFLSATMVVLGLVATATGFSDGFLVTSAILLTLDLFIGVTSLGRIAVASNEDIRFLQAMNRIRHAYHEMVPGLERYLTTSHYDDLDSTLRVYGPAEFSAWRGIAHGFTTAPAMISVICCAVAAAIAAVLILLGGGTAFGAAIGGAITFVVSFVVAIAIVGRAINRFGRSLEVRFPRPARDDTPPEEHHSPTQRP